MQSVRTRRERRRRRQALVRCGWADIGRGLISSCIATTTTTSGAGRCATACALFERMSLEAFQSGLSWLIILRKRENFRRAFHGFDIERVARYTERDVQRLMADAGIVRNRAKIDATIANARAAADLDLSDLSELLWSFAPPPRPRPADDLRSSLGHAGIHGHGEGAETARFPVRRAHHRLRVDAGDRHGRRPHPRLLGASR